MKPTIIITGVCDEFKRETKMCADSVIQDLSRDGETVPFTNIGAANVTLARNVNYSNLLHDAREQEWPLEAIVLSLDHDVTFGISAVRDIVKHVRETKRPASGVYPTAGGLLHAARDRGVIWECGLGFAAFSLQMLSDAAEALPLLELGQLPRRLWPFCQSGVHPTLPTAFTPEDFWFCRTLGGFDLLPIPIGHLKTFPIFPDDQTLQLIADGEQLPGEVQAEVSLRPMNREGTLQ